MVRLLIDKTANAISFLFSCGRTKISHSSSSSVAYPAWHLTIDDIDVRHTSYIAIKTDTGWLSCPLVSSPAHHVYVCVYVITDAFEMSQSSRFAAERAAAANAGNAPFVPNEYGLFCLFWLLCNEPSWQCFSQYRCSFVGRCHSNQCFTWIWQTSRYI